MSQKVNQCLKGPAGMTDFTHNPGQDEYGVQFLKNNSSPKA
jgi:hypothetical protein